MIQAYWSTGHGFLAVFSYFSRSRSTNWMQWSTIFSTPKRPQSFLFLNGPRKLAAAMATPYQRQWHQLRRRRGCAKYKLLPGEESLSLSLFLVHSLAGTGAPQLEPFLEPSSGSLGRHFAVNLAPRPLLSAPAARAAPAEAAALTLVWWLFCSPSSSVFTWFYRLFTCPFFLLVCLFVCFFINVWLVLSVAHHSFSLLSLSSPSFIQRVSSHSEKKEETSGWKESCFFS